MNVEKQRIAIASHTGWVDIEYDWENHDAPPEKFLRGVAPEDVARHRKNWTVHSRLPRYTKDLNAMGKVEDTLEGEQRFEYQRNLHNLNVKYNLDPSIWETVHAGPAQRAEAYLRTVGLWKVHTVEEQWEEIHTQIDIEAVEDSEY